MTSIPEDISIKLTEIELKINDSNLPKTESDKSDYYYLQFNILIDLHFLQSCRFTDLIKLSDFYPLTNYELKKNTSLLCFKNNSNDKYKISNIQNNKKITFNKSNFAISTHLDLLNIEKNKLFILSNPQLNFNIYESLTTNEYKINFVEYIKNTYTNYEIFSSVVNILKETQKEEIPKEETQKEETQKEETQKEETPKEETVKNE